MRVLHSIDEIVADDFAQGTAVAIGKFDGLHLGHHEILSRVNDADPLTSVVFTFANNPLSYLRPERCPKALMSREQRLEKFADERIDTCVMVEFDAAFSAIPAESFIEHVLVGKLQARRVVLGADFRFGRGGLGDAEMLREMGDRLGFSVEVVEWVTEAGPDHVSSSRIRETILAGDVASATRMLGRYPAVRGEVVHGDARGRELGFPTANLGGRVEGLVPADGVYAGTVVLDGVERVAAISVGVNLTFEPEGEPRVEAFLLDFSGDLYGKRMEVRFADRLRGMLKFESIDELIDCMTSDVTRTRELLANTALTN